MYSHLVSQSLWWCPCVRVYIVHRPICCVFCILKDFIKELENIIQHFATMPKCTVTWSVSQLWWCPCVRVYIEARPPTIQTGFSVQRDGFSSRSNRSASRPKSRRPAPSSRTLSRDSQPRPPRSFKPPDKVTSHHPSVHTTLTLRLI